MSELDEKLLNRVKDELIKEGYLHIHGIEKFWPEVCRRYAEEVYRPDFELVDKHIGELEQKISQLKKQLEDAEEKAKFYEDILVKQTANSINPEEIWNAKESKPYLKSKLEVKEKPDFYPIMVSTFKEHGLWVDSTGEKAIQARLQFANKIWDLCSVPRDAAIAERDEKIKELGWKVDELNEYIRVIEEKSTEAIVNLIKSRIASLNKGYRTGGIVNENT